jgi:AraC-like DNA-binding protein
MEPLPGCIAQADVSTWAYGNIGIILGMLGGVRQVAAPNARDLIEDAFLGVSIAGVAVISHRGRELTLQRGDAVLFSSAKAGFTSSRPKPSYFLGLRLPRRMLAQLVANLDQASMRLIPGQSQPLRLLVDYIRLLGSRGNFELSGFGYAISAHILDLLALTIGVDRDVAAEAEARGVRAARLQALKADVWSRLRDGELSVAAVAARHGVTPRYIHKLFEGEGATFSEFVLARRLEFAHRLLTDRRLSNRSITSIASDAGFADLSHFNRAFRRRYNATPTEVRTAEKYPD